LSRPPERITVADVVRALDQPDQGTTVSGPAAEGDVLGLIWNDLAERVTAVLDETTLADFVDRAESLGVRRGDAEPPMYFI
jgi:DNA-binding IscR family transcriptional regulator